MTLSRSKTLTCVVNFSLERTHCGIVELALWNWHCGKHPNEESSVYCLDCETSGCLLCLTTVHQKHDVSAVGGILETLKEEMQKGIGRVGGVRIRNGETLEALETQGKIFLENVETAKVGICQREEELKRLVEKHCREMMEELENEKLNEMKEVENMKEDIKTNNTILDYYIKYTETLLDKQIYYVMQRT